MKNASAPAPPRQSASPPAPGPAAVIRAVGIDLGTTNSAAAEVVWDPASGVPPEVRVLEIEQPTREGSYTSPLVPSVVAVLPDDTVWVGEGAKRLRAFLADYGLSFEKNLFYDTKNEMGLRKTYYRAPESFDHASKIGGKVLGFIAREAAGAGAAPDRVSVTVPASFQLNQRRDTLLAAQYAGLSLADDDLLDEPTAALIDHLIQLNRGRNTLSPNFDAGKGAARSGNSEMSIVSPNKGRPRLCVVFDFGGGTCDVSVIEISQTGAPDAGAPDAGAPDAAAPDASSAPGADARASASACSSAPPPASASCSSASVRGLLPASLAGLTMAQLSVSRYHRLGGGDIDAAIVHEVLIPRLLAENHLGPLDIPFAQKKKGLEPQLLGKAEALKIALCSEIDRLAKFGRYGASTDKASIVVRQPSHTCRLGAASYALTDPSLSAAEFERLLAPFLDADFLFARTTEYRMTQSLFAPLRDAMDRAGRAASDVDLCLMVGGSSLIPQVRDAVRAFFPKARHVFHGDGLESKLCVARGAAWNAAFMAAAGRPLVQSVLHDGIVLITAAGTPTPLIPSRTPLPFPPDGSFLQDRLVVPPAPGPVRELRFEVAGELDGQHIFDDVWRLPEPVEPGTEIVLEYRVTRGKQFDCRAYLASRPSVLLEKSVENPLVNIANPNATMVKIEEAEEKLRSRRGGTARDRDGYIGLARMYAEINQREKALDYLRAAQSRQSQPDPGILLLQGIYFSELGDHGKALTAYVEADCAAPLWGAPLFNQAILLRRQGRHAEALDVIERALRRVGEPGPYLALKALALDSLGRSEESRAAADKAVRAFSPPATLDDWELGWLVTAAQTAADEESRKRAEEELRKRRRGASAAPAGDDVLRPAIVGDASPGAPPRAASRKKSAGGKGSR